MDSWSSMIRIVAIIVSQEGAHNSSPVRRIPIEGSHGQGLSGRSSDDGLGSEMDFVILIVRFTAGKRHNLLLSDWVKLLDRGVVDMTTIPTTQAGRPHLPIGALQV